MNNGPEDASLDHGDADAIAAEALRDAQEGAQLDTSLRQALRHEDPPVGFADRVVARALRQEEAVPHPPAQGRLLPWPVRQVWVRGTVAAALLLGLFEGNFAVKRFREQQRRVATATAQFQTTERVTVHALAQARAQLERAGVPLTLD